MSEKLKRYEPDVIEERFGYGYIPDMVRLDDGEWVKYEDVKGLEARVAELDLKLGAEKEYSSDLFNQLSAYEKKEQCEHKFYKFGDQPKRRCNLCCAIEVTPPTEKEQAK